MIALLSPACCSCSEYSLSNAAFFAWSCHHVVSTASSSNDDVESAELPAAGTAVPFLLDGCGLPASAAGTAAVLGLLPVCG